MGDQRLTTLSSQPFVCDNTDLVALTYDLPEPLSRRRVWLRGNCSSGHLGVRSPLVSFTTRSTPDGRRKRAVHLFAKKPPGTDGLQSVSARRAQLAGL